MDLDKLRAIEEARRLRERFEPYQDQIEKHRRIIEQVSPFQEEIEKRRRIQEALMPFSLQQIQALNFQTPESMNALQLLAEKVRADVNRIAADSLQLLAERVRAEASHIVTSAFVGISRQAEQWNRQLSDAFNAQYKNSAIALAQAVSAGTVWRDEIERLTKAVQAHRIDVQFPVLTDRLFRPAEYFTSYTQSRAERLNTTENENEGAALRGALDLAETEFSEGVLLTESLIESDVGIVEPSPRFIYNLYEEQEQELLRFVGKDGRTQIEDVSSVFDLMNTKRIARLTREVLNLVATCNQESRTRGGSDIFKLTNAVFEAAADLPLLIVKNKESLVSLIRHLFRMIYEGAGDRNLRFMAVNGGWLEDGECDAIWTLKALRNKLSLHDAEHGKEADIKKSYATLGNALGNLGLSGMPITEDEFLALQESMLTQLKDFLTNLALKMRK
jgi:hypothetical protein